MTPNIVIVGSCMIDFVSYASRLPTAGETIHGDKFVTNFGGKGANQCVAAAKLGGNTSLVAKLGDDIWGSKYIDNLIAQGVNTNYVKIAPNISSGIAQINVSNSGENQIVIVAGANQLLTPEDIHQASTIISDASVVILQLETPVDTAIKAMKLSNGITILNGAPALTTYDEQILTLPTIFCVNETEASIFSGQPIHSISDAESAARKLILKGCKSVLITLGEQGALYLTNNCNKAMFRAVSPKVKCIDTTGAGDAFLGGLAYFLAVKGFTIEKAIEAACMVAADSVTRLGTQISFPGPEIINRIKT